MRSILLAVLLLNSVFASALTCPYTIDQSFSYLKAKFPDVVAVDNASGLAAIKYIEFGDVGFADSDLPYLCSLKSLESLGIYNDKSDSTHPGHLTGINLEYLTLLENLKNLDLDGNDIHGFELRRLQGSPHLQTVRFGMGNPVGDFGVEKIAEIPTLNALWLQSTGLVAEDLNWLSRLSRPLESVIFLGNTQLGNTALIKLAKAKVHELWLVDIGLTSSANFELLALNTDLQTLRIYDGGLSEKDLIDAVGKLQGSLSLQNLVLKDSQAMGYQYSPALAKAIAAIPNLNAVTMTANLVKQKDIADVVPVLFANPNIKTITLYSLPFGDFLPQVKSVCAAAAAYPDRKIQFNLGMDAKDCSNF